MGNSTVFGDQFPTNIRFIDLKFFIIQLTFQLGCNLFKITVGGKEKIRSQPSAERYGHGFVKFQVILGPFMWV